MTIQASALRSTIFTDIKAQIVGSAISYYDNSGTLKSGVTVTGSYIDDDQHFPQIVVNPANIGKDNYGFDREYYDNTIDVMIDIFDTRSRNIDFISDQLDNLSGLKKISGMMLINWVEARAYPVENDNKIHLKSITLTYKRR